MRNYVNEYYNADDVHVTEKEKSSFNYLKSMVDFHINDLVIEKKRIKKARNLYEGVRDPEEYKYLQETFGIETPIAIKMTPLIKIRIDTLLGILLDDVFTFRVSVNDENTLTKIEDIKKSERARRIIEGYNKQLAVNNSRVGKGQAPQEDVITKKFFERIEQSINEDFISEFEIAAQSLITFFQQDITIDLKQKVKQFFLDLLTSGESYYRTYVSRMGEDPKLRIIKPENLFYKSNTNNQYLSTGSTPNVTAVVNREKMHRTEVLSKWGHLMNKTTRDDLFGASATSGVRINDPRRLDQLHNSNGGYEDSAYQTEESNSLDTLEVFHVEWLANNRIEILDEEYKDGMQVVDDIRMTKEEKASYGEGAGSGKARKYAYRLDRYEGIRIGQDIYLNLGKSKHIPRSIGQPWLTTLSYNGIAYNSRNGKPYSIALALKDIQDSFDIITFFRDNLIANSGVDGSRVNLAAIPKVLGQDFTERLLTFIAYRKQGIELYDPTEDGANLFQQYGDYKGSMNPGTLQGLEAVLEGLQKQADIVTGVNRHMYQAAEVRDAVSNVQAGQKQVSLITKDIFQLVHTSQKHMITDLVNKAKITYRKGKRGSYIVGHRNILFNVKADSFCFTDHNIHVVNSTEENIKLEHLKSIVPELVGNQSMDPDILVEISLSNSPTEIRRMVRANIAKKKEENDQAGQMQQQIEEASNQIQELQKDLEEASKEIESLNKIDTQIKNREVALKEKAVDDKGKLGEDRLSLDTIIAEREVDKDEKIVQLEREQLYLETSGNAKEIRNNI